jgi:hypothetical protein
MTYSDRSDGLGLIKLVLGMIVSNADIFLQERTILYCVAHADSITHAYVSPPRADIVRSRGPCIRYVRTSIPRMRTAFIHSTPSGHFWSLVLRTRTILSSIGPFSPRADLSIFLE